MGFVGLGTMGRPMAASVLSRRPDLALSVFARRREAADELVESGAIWRDTAHDLAAASDVVVSMLPDLAELEELLEAEDGLLSGVQAELLLVIGSTSSPDGVRRLAVRLEERTDGRVTVVDAPVSGGEDGATEGALSIMVGGEEEGVGLARQVLEACGTVVHLGPLGAGEVAKACNQLVVGATVLALGEAAVLADRSGLDVSTLFELLGGGYAGSRILSSRGPKIAAQDYTPSGMAKYLVKDLSIGSEIAADTGTRPALLVALTEAFVELSGSGLGDRDMAVTRLFTELR